MPKKNVWIGAGIAFLFLLAAAGYFFFSGQDGAKPGKESPLPTLSAESAPFYKDELILIPVNWDSKKDDFSAIVTEAVREFRREYLEVNEKVFPLLDNDEKYFQSQFEITVLPQCMNICRFEEQPNLLDLEERCVNRCQEKKSADPHPTYIALTNDEKYEEGNYQEYTSVIVVAGSAKDVSSVTHEIGHLFWPLCDEYAYDVWKEQDRESKASGEAGCPNSYPLVCADHPQWAQNKNGYRRYLQEKGVGWNGYQRSEETPGLCAGAVCPASPGYATCRSVMGPAISPEDFEYYFGGRLEHKIPLEALQN